MKRLLPLAAALLFTAAHADEGQWQPYQMAQLQAELKRIGIKVPVRDLSDLSKHPMSAIVSLGGCSASFVSPNGLIVTNHHCAYGSIQRNSTAANNYLAKGFLAKTLAEELPGGPNQRVYVTESVRDVTAEVLNGVAPALGGAERTRLIERNSKSLIAAELPPRPGVLPDPADDGARRAPGVRAVRGHRQLRRRHRQLRVPAPHRRLRVLPRLRRQGRPPGRSLAGQRAVRLEGLPDRVGRRPEARRRDPAGRLSGRDQPRPPAGRNPLCARQRLPEARGRLPP